MTIPEIIVDSPLTAIDVFPRAVASVPHLFLVDGDAAEMLADIPKGWTLPHFIAAASVELHGHLAYDYDGDSVRAVLSAGVFIAAERLDGEARHPYVFGALALAALREAAEIVYPDSVIDVEWPGALRVVGGAEAAISMDAVERGVIVGFEVDLKPQVADLFLGELLVALAGLIARYQIAGGELGAGLDEVVRSIFAPAFVYA